MKQIKAILIAMFNIAREIERLDEIINDAPAIGSNVGASEISGMIQDANEVIASLIKQYRALSAEQSILLREYEIKDCKKPDFSDVGQGNKMVFAHTSHNREIFNDLTKDFAA